MPPDPAGWPPSASGGFEGAAESEDVLTVGRDSRTGVLVEAWADRVRRVPRLTRWLGAVSLALALGGGYLLLRPTGGPTVQVADPAPDSGGHYANDGALDTVAATARDIRPLRDYVRSNSAPGACAVVPMRATPQQNLVTAVRKALPDYSVRDVGRTLDEFTAMCNLQLRASDTRGSALVVTVAAPSRLSRNPFDQVTVASRSDGSGVVSIVADVTRAGWTITVGAIGPVSDQPSSAVMLALAQDPMLRW
jgi:hypothetical protein